MKLVNLEQRVIVPITDQTKGGIQYEVEISIEELLKGSLEDFEPVLVDAIPVEWLKEFDLYYAGISGGSPYMKALIEAWQKEQEG